MTTEKVFKVYIETLIEASAYFQIHKTDIWSKQLDKSVDLLLNCFRKQQQETNEWKELFYLIKSNIEKDENWRTDEWMVKAKKMGIDV